ncbi:hypothetical protein CBR_g26334 [Chara braunii]|uniref:DUF659 domain-containing protein n=1 Tax=Chara braunii TaxID=69332 RepID=A0A388L7Q5_CHABU|nr:hypothetical protein CBR_g26334 [Chara braunii]|eukprot:GBG78304.1 hypothetical protein CBR_g26334 [Chara braunii]
MRQVAVNGCWVAAVRSGGVNEGCLARVIDMGRSQRRQHEAAADHVQDTFRARSPVYRYLVVGQKVDNKGVMMLRCTFCNKLFHGTQFQATRHFSQTNYCKDVSDEALYEIARRTLQKFEADKMERVSRYAAERGLDVPDTGGARGGEAGRHPAEGGVGGDGGHGAADPTLGGGGGETEEARGLGDEGVPEREDVRKGAATEGSSKRKEAGSDPAATPTRKRLRQQKVTDVYGGEWVARHKKAFLRWLYSSGVSFNAFRNQAWKAYQQVLLEQPGSSLRAVLPNHCEIVSVRAVETHRAELAEELEEVRQPFWVTGATLLSDGRKSRDGRPIVNFLADGSRGVVVYTTINREGKPDDAVHVLRRWVTIFHEFSFGGPQRINAICTDSASAYVGAARALTSPSTPLALRRITWLPCSVHVCNKLLSDMGTSCDAFVNAITLARVLVVFFKTHQVHFFRMRSPEKGLILSCETRFASVYSMLERLLALQDTLQDMMRGDDARAFASIPWSADVCVMARWRRGTGQSITANVRLSEYRRAGCGYVLPWQWDEGMLDCQAGLELEPVRTGTRRGMTDEEFARQVALITRDPIGASAPPSADAVFDRRACIFRPYPRDDDSDEVPIPEVADDPALCIPREIDKTHEDPDSKDTRTQTARRAANRAESEMLGGDEDFWGPFGEVASTGGPEAQATTPTPTRRDSSMPPPPAPSPAPRSPVSPLQPDREELGSSLPQRGLLHRGGAVRQLRLRSPSPGIGQEEGGPSTAAVESSMAPAAVSDATIAAAVEEIAAAAAAAAVLEEMAASVLAEDPPAAGGGAAVEGQVAAAGGARGGGAAVEVEVAAALEEEDAPSAVVVEEEIAAQEEVHRGGDDERLMQQFLTEDLGPAIAGMTPGVERGFGISNSEMGTHLDLDLSVGLPPSCGGATSTDRAPSRDEAPGRTSTQTARERTTTQSPDAAHDIMERERARLLASTGPRAQAFPRAVEDTRRLEIGGDCVQGGVVAGEDVAEGVAAEPVPEAMPGGADTAGVAVEGRTQAVDEAVQAGQRRVEGAINSRREGQETATGSVVPFSGLHLAQARQPQAVQMAVHGVPPPVITDLGSEPVVVPPRLPSHFAPQEVRCSLDAEELAREAVRDVTRLDRRIFDRKLEHPRWQSIPSVPWGPASPMWSGSTSTGGHTAGHVPRVSGGVTETAPHTGNMPPPPPRAPARDPSSSPTGRGSRSPHTPGRSRIRDTTAVQQDVCDTTIFGRTDIHLDSTRRVTEHTARLQPGLGGGGARTTTAREVPASGCEPQRGRSRGISTDTLEYALRAATRAVQEQTPRKRGVPPRPRPVPAEGGATLGESSGAEGLGMPRGSRREQTIAEASARVVVLRKGGGPDTIEEDDPNTDAAVRDVDEDYEGEEEGEEDSRSGSDGDDDDDYDEPPPSLGPPPTRASRRSAARTSSSSRGRKRSTSGTRGGTRRHSRKGKKGR